MKNRITRILSDFSDDAFNSFHYWRHNLKGNRWADLSFSHSKHPPIVLLQGFMGTQGVLQPLSQYLKSSDRNVITLDLGAFNVRDIRKSAAILSYQLERINELYCESHSFEKMDIVGHSMGGLIGLFYLKKLGGHRLIRKLITLGAPFQGTWAALLGAVPIGLFSKGIWQLLPTSEFLENLHADSKELQDTKVISLAAAKDSICPPESCYLKGAINHTLPIGHAGLLVDSMVFETVKQFLESDEVPDNVIPFSQKNSKK